MKERTHFNSLFIIVILDHIVIIICTLVWRISEKVGVQRVFNCHLPNLRLRAPQIMTIIFLFRILDLLFILISALTEALCAMIQQQQQKDGNFWRFEHFCQFFFVMGDEWCQLIHFYFSLLWNENVSPFAGPETRPPPKAEIFLIHRVSLKFCIIIAMHCGIIIKSLFSSS